MPNAERNKLLLFACCALLLLSSEGLVDIICAQITKGNIFHCEAGNTNYSNVIKHLTVISCKWLRFIVGSVFSCLVQPVWIWMWVVFACSFRYSPNGNAWWLNNICGHAISPFIFFSIHELSRIFACNAFRQWWKVILRWAALDNRALPTFCSSSKSATFILMASCSSACPESANLFIIFSFIFRSHFAFFLLAFKRGCETPVIPCCYCSSFHLWCALLRSNQGV